MHEMRLNYLEQCCWRKDPIELEGWGFKKLSVSPRNGHPNEPFGTILFFNNNGRKWFKIAPNRNPTKPTTKIGIKTQAIYEMIA